MTIKGFTFYSNYYELTKNLNESDRLLIYDSIFEYMFEEKEPELEGLIKGIWVNLKMPLDTSKNNAGRGGRPKKTKTEKKPIGNRLKTEGETVSKTNNISNFLFLISNFLFLKDKGLLREKMEDWLKYKWEKKEYYKETGFKSLLNKIEKATNEYGEEKVIDLIDECMANNYSGIIFDKLKEKKISKTERKSIYEL